jgi:transposase
MSPAQQAGLEAGLRSPNAFSLRRSQILLASRRGQRPSEIARNLGCAVQTVRTTLHAFEEDGVACLKQQSSRPKTIHAQFDQPKCEALRAMLHQSPGTYGKKTSLWTLALAAQVCQELGLSERQLSIETIRLALRRLKLGWRRAKAWITSPDPDYARKKNGAPP